MKGLKTASIGFASSFMMALASTAPAYSLAASLGQIVSMESGDGIIGVFAPSILVLAFLPMWAAAVAFQQLNRVKPDCGATFTWALLAFGPYGGFLVGWSVIASNVLVMSNLASIAGSYTLRLVTLTDLADTALVPTILGVLWIVLMTAASARGIEVSSSLQAALLVVEMLTLFLFGFACFGRVGAGTAPDGYLIPSPRWLFPEISPSAYVRGTAVAIFVYWGWDSAISVNEETSNPTVTPGRAAVASTAVLLLSYAFVSVGAVSFGGVGSNGTGLANHNSSSDVFLALGDAVFGDAWYGKLAMGLLHICILTSATACTQTTILPTTRAMLAMGLEGALPSWMGRVHPKWGTPIAASVAFAAVSVVVYLALVAISASVMADSVSATGMLIAFYYGATAWSCVILRGPPAIASRRVRPIVMRLVVPLLGAVFLSALFFTCAALYASDEDFSETKVGPVGSSFLFGVGAMVLGVVLCGVWRVVHPHYFVRWSRHWDETETDVAAMLGDRSSVTSVKSDHPLL